MNVKSTILIDPFPATGHINACITLARFLAPRGGHIWFSGLQNFRNIIRNEGFDYYIIPSFLFTTARIEIEEKGRLKFIMENIGGSRFKRIQKKFKKTASDYDRMIDSVKPDLILLDDHYAQKAFYYSKYQIPIIAVQTMLPPLKSKGVPPFQSKHIPTNNKLSHSFTEWLWKKNMVGRTLKKLKNNVLTLGQTDLSVLRSLCPDSELTIQKERCFGVGIRELPMISTSPKAFDFPRSMMNTEVFYFGKHENSSFEKIEDRRLLDLLKKVQEQKNLGQDKMLIYCSLGTLTQIREKICRKFFRKIIITAKNHPAIEFILSIGEHFDINDLSDTPENLRIFSLVPQKQLLENVDIMITAGGLNSIRECIDAEVPMIVYPMNKKADQPGNGARVAFHNLGVTGNIRTASPRSVSRKIGSVLDGMERFRRSLRRMKQKIRESNRTEEKKILELIFQLTGKRTGNLKAHYEIH
ncbi:glycosyltransferase [Rhodohalobacter sulfatireducens]|uniref:Glycosyltransferase n=1 Tax=Rhodohalobacter sulfatireducens TaxID=2911366 RepID=A0ABS9KED2_9BACT|nr:glycosyltransferase [Rhodohalobacter sulfatireducens]MCG2589185.1 glycosyltransferase [Rhodohalobacter sulfatireducens]